MSESSCRQTVHFGVQRFTPAEMKREFVCFQMNSCAISVQFMIYSVLTTNLKLKAAGLELC